MRKRKSGICRGCNETMELYTRGLCNRCFNRLRRKWLKWPEPRLSLAVYEDLMIDWGCMPQPDKARAEAAAKAVKTRRARKRDGRYCLPCSQKLRPTDRGELRCDHCGTHYTRRGGVSRHNLQMVLK